MEPTRDDEFEDRLRARALRPIPADWRASILESACRASAPPRSAFAWLRGWRDTLHGWLWPSPIAWSGVAVAWAVIITLNRAAAFEPTPTPWAGRIDAGTFVLALREQRRQIDELLAASPAAAAELPAEPPVRPRSALSVTNRIA